MLIFAFVTFQLPRAQLTDVYYLMAVTLMAGSVFSFQKKIREEKPLLVYVLCAVLSFLYLGILTVFSLGESPLAQSAGSGQNWLWTVYEVFFITLTFSAAFIILFSVQNLQLSGKEDKEKMVRSRRIAFAVIVLVSLAFLLGSYPGLRYPDITNAWEMAVYEDWDEWHTMGFILFIRLFSYVWENIYIISIVQTAIWLGLNYYVLSTISVFKQSRAIWLYSVCSVMLLLPYIYLQAMLKDTLFAMGVLGCCTGIFHIVHDRHLRLKDLVCTTVFACFVALFRHAGLVIVLIALLFACLVRMRLKLGENFKPFVSMGVIGAVYVLLIVVLSRNILHATPNPAYIKYTIPFYMAGELASDEQVQMDEEDIEFLETFADIEDWHEAHSKYFADPVARGYGILYDIEYMYENEYGPQMLALNLKYLLRCPGRYLTHYSHITSILWQAARPADGYEWGPIEGMAVDYAEGTGAVMENFWTVLTREISNLSGRLPVVRSVLWRGGWVQFVYTALICFLALHKKKRYICVALPVVIYQASLYLSIPSQDPRYVLPMIETLPLFLVVCGFAGQKSETAYE